MGPPVRIVFLAADDPIYLPEFFERVLATLGEQTEAVFSVPPFYKGQTPIRAAWRYYRSFGAEGVARLTTRVALAKARRRSIASLCRKRGIAHSVVRDVNASEFVAQLSKLQPDLVVSVSCPQIFKKPLLNVPAIGCLNIHGAILPDYRGVMPSFWMLANGESEAGVSIFFMNEDIDAGDVVGQSVFAILPDETLHGFLRRSKNIAADLLVETVQAIASNAVTRLPLDSAAGSYYSWPDREAVKRFRAQGRRL